MSEQLTCVVCEASFPPGTDDTGTWRDDCAKSGYTVCRDCHTGGDHEKWRTKAIEALRSSPTAFISLGNLALDYAELCRYQKSDERIEDGICPNGCARMHDAGHTATCPSCGFTLNRVTLHVTPEP